MKKKKIILLFFLLLTLVACKKVEENYQVKKKDVDSVFDKIDVPNKLEREAVRGETILETDVETNTIKRNIKKTIGNIYFRKSPEIINDNVISIVKEGDVVEIIETTEKLPGTWVKVIYKNQEGYMDGKFLK